MWPKPIGVSNDKGNGGGIVGALFGLAVAGAVLFASFCSMLPIGGFGLTVWDTSTIKVLQTHKNFLINFPVQAVAYSADGTRLAQLSDTFKEPEIKIRDAGTGKQTVVLPLQRGVDSIALNADGSRLALPSVPSDEGLPSIAIWNLATGKKEKNLAGSFPHSLSFCPDGRHLAQATVWFEHKQVNSEVKVWDLDQGERVHSFPPLAGQIALIAFSPDGQRLIAVTNTQARIWDLAKAKEFLTFSLPTGFRKAALSGNGKRLAVAGQDGAITIWDVERGQEMMNLKGL